MINCKKMFVPVTVSLLLAVSAAAMADSRSDRSRVKQCTLSGSYSFDFTGVSYETGEVPFAEAGILYFGDDGEFSLSAALTFQFTDFFGAGPLWLHVDEQISDASILPDSEDPCLGMITFKATGTVLRSTNPALLPPGVPFYRDLDRSIEYSIGGKHYDTLRFVSTSPFTIASGSGEKIGHSKKD